MECGLAHNEEIIKKGGLSTDRIEYLKSVHGWTWDPFDSVWEDNYNNIKKYVKENGALPRRSDKEFGLWIQSQRSKYEKYNSTIEGRVRIKKLELLEGWFWDVDFDAMWEQHITDLMMFIQTNKKLPKQSEGLLGAWIGTQRQNYRKNKLSLTQIHKLETIKEWSWIPFDSIWDLRFSEFNEFVKLNNRLPKINGEPLGRWGDKQRTMYKNDKLSVDRIKKLESINGWTWNIFGGGMGQNVSWG